MNFYSRKIFKTGDFLVFLFCFLFFNCGSCLEITLKEDSIQWELVSGPPQITFHLISIYFLVCFSMFLVCFKHKGVSGESVLSIFQILKKI